MCALNLGVPDQKAIFKPRILVLGVGGRSTFNAAELNRTLLRVQHGCLHDHAASLDPRLLVSLLLLLLLPFVCSRCSLCMPSHLEAAAAPRVAPPRRRLRRRGGPRRLRRVRAARRRVGGDRDEHVGGGRPWWTRRVPNHCEQVDRALSDAAWSSSCRQSSKRDHRFKGSECLTWSAAT